MFFADGSRSIDLFNIYVISFNKEYYKFEMCQ